MRLYIHMAACGSICTLLYIFFNCAFPWELPLKWKKVFLRVNTMLYLLPVPWLAAQIKGLIRTLLARAGMVFTNNERSEYIDTANIWESILVVDEKGKLLYITGYRNWLAVIGGGCFIFAALAVGFLAVYLLTCRRYKRMAEFPGGRYAETRRGKVRIGTSACVTSPLTVGVIRPVVLLPDGALDGMPEGTLEKALSGREEGVLACVLRHEICHVSGRDIQGKFLAFLAIATEWFNPLAYYLFKENAAVSEMLCDMAAVEGRTKKEKLAYMECIIAAAEKPEGAAAVSLAASKKLMRKRVERIMGKNVKKVCKKGVAVTVTAVCFMAGSIPVLAYEDAMEYTTTRESFPAENWENTDWLKFNWEDAEAVYPEFGQGDAIFTDGDGNVYYINSPGENSDIQEQAACQHTYEAGTAQYHSKNPDGSCTVVTYNARGCTICGDVAKGTRVSTLTYDICPH